MRLTDASNVLSLTNLCVISAVAEMFVAPVVGLPHVATLFLTLLNYATKKFLDIRAAHTAAVNGQAIALDALAKTVVDTAKQVESIKAKLGLSQAFGKL